MLKKVMTIALRIAAMPFLAILGVIIMTDLRYPRREIKEKERK